VYSTSQESVVSLGTVRFRGPDAAGFLNGQFSSDVLALPQGAEQLSGYHNPQGRVIALLRLARVDREEWLAQLPLELAAPIAQRLQRFVLRAKLAIDVLDTPAPNATRSRRADIAAGLPQIYAATSEKFVAQMLNLDCIGAVSFSKGCYTGQEVIARAHYRGRVKRRMQRFVTRAAPAGASTALLQPGASLHIADGRRLEIVDAAMLEDRRVEFLGVGPLPGADADTTTTALHDTPPLIDCDSLPLPYDLPA
jgi:folate-binding protein YgfZ